MCKQLAWRISLILPKRSGKFFCGEEEKRYASLMQKLYIWYHHLSNLGRIFEKRFTRFTCCNLFKTHKQNVKGGHKISLQLATKLLDHRYDCIPDWQLCRTCCDIAQKIEKNVGNEMSQSEHESPQINKLDSATTDYSTSDIDSDEARK